MLRCLYAEIVQAWYMSWSCFVFHRALIEGFFKKNPCAMPSIAAVLFVLLRPMTLSHVQTNQIAAVNECFNLLIQWFR